MPAPPEFFRLVRSGCVLFALGLLCGLVYTFVLIGRVEVWPLPGQIALPPVSDVDAWRRAHLGTLMNAFVVLVFALTARTLRVPGPSWFVFSLCAQVTAWMNSLAFVLAAVLGVRGLSGGADVASSIVYLMFLIAVITAFVQCGLLARHACASASLEQDGP